MKFYHFTNIAFSIKREYFSKKNAPYFGDFEKLFEAYRPKDKPSRKQSFFLVTEKDCYFAEQFGQYKYQVESEQAQACYLFWNTALQAYCQQEKLIKGFKANYGYLLNKPNKEQRLVIERIVGNYFMGVKPKASDYQQFDIEKDAETSVIEYLAPKIKIIKKL